MLDYRVLQERASALQAKIGELTAKAELTVDEQAEVMRLTGEVQALERTAGEIRDAEIAELRAIVARGNGQAGEPSAEDRSVSEFLAYLKTGEVGPILAASLSTTDANGGYIVAEPKHAELIEKVRKNDPIFGRATHFDLRGGSRSIELPYKLTHGVATTAAEDGARSEQNAPTFAGPTLTCEEYYTDQRATQLYLDSVAGAEDMLLTWIYEDIYEQAGADAVNGDGTTKIKGLFAETATYTTLLSGAAGALANTAFLTQYFTLPVKFRSRAAWLMSGATLATVAAMTYPGLTDVPLATQDASGEWRILGKPVVETDSAPAIGAANYPVAFADIAAAYAVGTHREVSVLRDPYTAVPKVKFYGLGRLGGCAWHRQAAVLMKSNNA